MSAVWASLYLLVGWLFAEKFLAGQTHDRISVKLMGCVFLLFFWPVFLLLMLLPRLMKGS